MIEDDYPIPSSYMADVFEKTCGVGGDAAAGGG